MGKNYQNEILQLAETYQWVAQQPIDNLREFVSSCKRRSLVCVGSGGSLTAASFAAFLHQNCSGALCRALTPLEVVGSRLDFAASAFLLLTASGRNPDIRAVFDTILQSERSKLGVLLTRLGSPLVKAAPNSCFEFGVPSGKDGFLATNSLLATIVLLARAYAESGFVDWRPSESSVAHFLGFNDLPEALVLLETGSAEVWHRKHLLVLHDVPTRPAALDIESRFSEAALGPVIVSDYRNFAHGRHVWLSRFKDDTAIIALTSRESEALADSVLALVPKGIPVLRPKLPDCPLDAAIGAILYSILIAGCAGKAQGLDPGQPTVAGFGRKMYHLGSLKKKGRSELLPSFCQVAVCRKSGVDWARLETAGSSAQWLHFYDSYIDRLKTANFKGFVFDYDGTLCELDRRFVGPGQEIVNRLVELLESNLVVGVATGRGKSVREQLRDCIPSKHHDKVLVSLYNGAESNLLSEERETVGPPNELLQVLDRDLKVHPSLLTAPPADLRPNQLTIGASTGLSARDLWGIVQSAILRLAPGQLKAFCSDHSLDVIPVDVSKKQALLEMGSRFGLDPDNEILTIGDRGLFPGNDSELLASAHSLSVFEVSADPGSCWNLAERGRQLTLATLDYLKLLRVSRSTARFGRAIWERAQR